MSSWAKHRGREGEIVDEPKNRAEECVENNESLNKKL